MKTSVVYFRDVSQNFTAVCSFQDVRLCTAFTSTNVKTLFLEIHRVSNINKMFIVEFCSKFEKKKWITILYEEENK